GMTSSIPLALGAATWGGSAVAREREPADEVAAEDALGVAVGVAVTEGVVVAEAVDVVDIVDILDGVGDVRGASDVAETGSAPRCITKMSSAAPTSATSAPTRSGRRVISAERPHDGGSAPRPPQRRAVRR